MILREQRGSQKLIPQSSQRSQLSLLDTCMWTNTATKYLFFTRNGFCLYVFVNFCFWISSDVTISQILKISSETQTLVYIALKIHLVYWRALTPGIVSSRNQLQYYMYVNKLHPFTWKRIEYLPCMIDLLLTKFNKS